MKPRLVVHDQAQDDVEEQALYIARDNVEAARRFMEATLNAFDDLLRMPEIGRPRSFKRSELAGLRSWAVRGFEEHLIFYRPTDDGIEVIRVLHGARDLENIFEP